MWVPGTQCAVICRAGSLPEGHVCSRTRRAWMCSGCSASPLGWATSLSVGSQQVGQQMRYACLLPSVICRACLAHERQARVLTPSRSIGHATKLQAASGRGAGTAAQQHDQGGSAHCVQLSRELCAGDHVPLLLHRSISWIECHRACSIDGSTGCGATAQSLRSVLLHMLFCLKGESMET